MNCHRQMHRTSRPPRANRVYVPPPLESFEERHPLIYGTLQGALFGVALVVIMALIHIFGPIIAS